MGYFKMDYECSITDIKVTSPWQVFLLPERTFYISGYVQDKKNILTVRELVYALDNCSSCKEITHFVDSLYGNFGFIYKTERMIIAVADKIRSVPIFYRNTPFEISSSPKKLLIDGSKVKVNLTSYFEFLLSGYVTSNETLIEGVRQLQAGEFLCISQGQLETIRYYTYPSDKVWSGRSETDIVEELDAVHCEVFERIITSLQGAQVMLPLSGGMDSRLVAAMLKRLKYDNVCCFAYGKVGHWEAETSRRVAYQLGYQWQHFPYNHSQWRGWFNSNEYRDYFQKVDNLSSLPPLLDWPVVLQFSNKHQQDAVFMPGHTGDFICGGHLSYLFQDFDLSLEHILRIILRKHFTLWCYKYLLKTGHPFIKIKLQQNLELKCHLTPQTIASAYERWEWQERQAKYIVNTVRTYDYFGFSWRIPLWDPALMEFWSKVPLEWKLNKKLYQRYFEIVNPCGVFEQRTTPIKKKFRQEMKQQIKYSKLGRPLQDLQKYLNWYGDYWNDNSQRYGLVSLRQFMTQRRYIRNVNAFFTKWYLNKFHAQFHTDFVETLKTKNLFDKSSLRKFSNEFFEGILKP